MPRRSELSTAPDPASIVCALNYDLRAKRKPEGVPERRHALLPSLHGRHLNSLEDVNPQAPNDRRYLLCTCYRRRRDDEL